jgi:hypothetical protein
VTLFRLADNLAIRVGRKGLWIWAPDVSEHPIFLDEAVLMEMGLHLANRNNQRNSTSPEGVRNPNQSA